MLLRVNIPTVVAPIIAPNVPEEITAFDPLLRVPNIAGALL